MLTRLCKDVIYLKDIKSNLIEEAFFILKESDNNKNQKKRKETAMMEINELVDEYSEIIQKFNQKEAKEKNKMHSIKITMTIIFFVFVLSCLTMAISSFKS